MLCVLGSHQLTKSMPIAPGWTMIHKWATVVSNFCTLFIVYGRKMLNQAYNDSHVGNSKVYFLSLLLLLFFWQDDVLIISFHKNKTFSR
jgi:hypothetical protein